MSSNLEFQNRQVNDRISSAMQEAKSHRLGKMGRRKRSLGFTIRAAALIAGGAILLSLLMSGCSPSPFAGFEEAAAAAPAGPAVSMADRIAFQDRVETASFLPGPGAGWTMADRIVFQDQLDQPASIDEDHGSTWTMAERIAFQDGRDQ